MSKRLLNKPLRDGLVGLHRRLDQLDGTRITQAITDCIQFILIEVDRLDCEAGI